LAERVEAQVERFVLGFENRIQARSTINTLQMEVYNPNYVVGDINVGVTIAVDAAVGTKELCRMENESTGTMLMDRNWKSSRV
jgi:hypothetical protein